MKLILPIAGAGKRMRPLTHTVHKALLPIQDKSILRHLIDMSNNIQGVELTEVVMITGHLKEQIEQWMDENYPDLKTTYVEQKVQNGTADAVRLAEQAVDGEDILLIYPDALIDADLEVIAEERDIDGVIWCQEVDNPQRFGIVEHDEDRLMTGVVEKPENPTSNLANIGMYYIRDSNSMFAMIGALYEHEMKTKGEYSLTDALDLMAKNGKRLLVEPVEGWWDTGAIETTLKTNREYCQRAGEDNTIDESAIVENSTLFNCIVMENARIVNCDLSNSIIGPRSIVKHTKGFVFVGADAHIDGNDNRD